MNKFLKIIVPILMVLLIIASIGWYLLVFDRDFTRDMLLQQARLNDLKGHTKVSAWFYNLAYVHSGSDENVAIELANQYKNDGNFTKAEVTLSNAIKVDATAELYTALCRTYVDQDKLMDAVALLANIPDPAIKETIDANRPTAPSSSQQPGFYTNYIKVDLMSSSGTLLYTTTGEYPSITNEPYSTPIVLPAGETVIYCISVDDNGLVSPMSILGYTVGGVIEPAVFVDPEMDSAVRAILNRSPEEVLYTNDLWEIKEFTVPETASSLEDLSLLSYLESLTIHDRKIDDLSAITSLAKLHSLDFTGCDFRDVELSDLTKINGLTSLTLSDCNLSTIAALEGCDKLTYLDLSNNTIRNLEVLSGMASLRELYLQHNAVNSLKELATLVNLEKLDISYNSVSGLSPLATCVKLNSIVAVHNKMKSPKGVASLPLLTVLNLNYNNLEKLTDLDACLQLKELSISNNSLTDLSALESLTKLEVLDFSYNAVEALPKWDESAALRVVDGSHNELTSVSVLGKMKNLTYASLDYNKLTSIDSLAKCNNLVQVNAYGNELKSVSKLTEHNIIVNYDPT